MDIADIHLARGTEAPKTRTPAESLLLAYLGMMPIAAGAAVSLLARPAAAREMVARLTTGWAGAILCFLAGVRRGLSFRQEGGPTVAQLGTMLWLFATGAGALLSPRRAPALVLLLLGYGSEAATGTIAAERGEAPRYFMRLRPAQMLVPAASLLLLLLATERGSIGDNRRS